MEKRKVILLGATGSIGTQTLDILRAHPEHFELVGVAAGHSKKALENILEEFDSVQAASLAAMDGEWQGNIPLYMGEEGMVGLIDNLDFDLLINATVGFRGLEPTLRALEKGKDVALANKESLVCGGELVKKALKESGRSLYPIDSEHSAIFQCLQGNKKEEVARLIITASGGSLRNLKREELSSITPERALAHPNWAMGKRITIDSATMVNKGFEVIEAHYLFDIPYEKIDTVLHPESIVHSMVEFQDHATMAQLGSADMHLPIQYALSWPQRWQLDEEKPLDMAKTLDLHFKEMDFERYPMLKLAIEAGKAKGNRPVVYNGADEQAVEYFLNGKIGFLDIETSIEKALQNIEQIENPTLEQLKESDRKAREFVKNLWQ